MLVCDVLQNIFERLPAERRSGTGGRKACRAVVACGAFREGYDCFESLVEASFKVVEVRELAQPKCVGIDEFLYPCRTLKLFILEYLDMNEDMGGGGGAGEVRYDVDELALVGGGGER